MSITFVTKNSFAQSSGTSVPEVQRIAKDAKGQQVGLVGANGSTIPLNSLGVLRFEGLSKPMPCSASNLAFNVTVLSTAKFTATVQKEEEGHFDAIRLVAVNRAVSAIGAITALVGTSEKAATFTALAQPLVAAPVVDGVTYSALQGVYDVKGFRNVTWASAASGALPAANSAQQVVLSDWAAKSSINRTDVVDGRPFSIVRAFVDGTLTPVAFMSNYVAELQVPAAPMRNRIIQSSNNVGNDAVGNPGLPSSAAILGLEVYPILRYRNPAFFAWICGDSLAAADALVTDHISNWLARACYDLSTMAKPVVPSNMGASTINSAGYIKITRAFLAAGVPPPSMLVAAPASVNDSGYDLNFQEKHLSQAYELARLAYEYRIPYLVMYGLFPNNGTTLAQDNIRKATNLKLKAVAEKVGAIWIDFPELGDGATPERWKPEYFKDVLHFNEKGIEDVCAQKLKAVIRPLL